MLCYHIYSIREPESSIGLNIIVAIGFYMDYKLSIYDYIIGSQMIFESAPSTMTKRRIDEFQNALNWFRVNNPEAYYVLLD